VVGSAIIKNMAGNSNPVDTTNKLIQDLKGIM
jgi:tryptophan synthase alpha subunit